MGKTKKLTQYNKGMLADLAKNCAINPNYEFSPADLPFHKDIFSDEPAIFPETDKIMNQ